MFAKTEVGEGRWERIHRLIEIVAKFEMSESGRKWRNSTVEFSSKIKKGERRRRQKVHWAIIRT